MIKRITKITLCTLSIVFFVLSVWFGATNITAEEMYQKTVFQSFGIHPLSTFVSINNNRPYTYINIPKTSDTPLALELFPPVISQNVSPPDDIEPEESGAQNDNASEERKKAFAVIKLDMSEKQSAGNLACKNESKYSPDINRIAALEYPIKSAAQTSTGSNAQPLVLIIHTHGTECYLPDNVEEYTEQTPTRCTDKNANVVSVGKVLADELSAKGVPTIHCETMFDEKSYSKSYELSEKAVIDYLKQYPSIQYIFDVHRDSIVRENKEKIKPITEIDGVQTAQAMFVVGTDSSGAPHPNWMTNLTVATKFQYQLVERYGTLMRPLNIRSASFNAEHAPGSILIEIGTCGNTLSEAQNCAALLGQNLAEIILNDGIIK